MTDARQYAGGGPEMLNMNASVNDGGRPLAPASVERPSPRECQCPVRPWATLGAFGSGSAAEARAMDAWAAEHGAHPYARARDDLATALQLAQVRAGSIGAVMHMVADVFGLPREMLGEAARDNKRLADMLCVRLADFCGEGGRNEGAVDTLNRLLAELERYRASSGQATVLADKLATDRTLADALRARLSVYRGEGGRSESAVETLDRLLAELHRFRQHIGGDLRKWVHDGPPERGLFSWTPGDVERILKDLEATMRALEEDRANAEAAQQMEAPRAEVRHTPHLGLAPITPQKVRLGEATGIAQQLRAPGKTFARMEIVAIVMAERTKWRNDGTDMGGVRYRAALEALETIQHIFENLE